MVQEEFRGPGSIQHLSDILARLNAQKIFLVTGKQSYQTSGAQQWIEDNLKGKLAIDHFREFAVNPKLEDIERGILAIQQSCADVIVAIGGGTVLDTAKIINALALQKYPPRDYILKKMKIKAATKPLITIPTTAGTGAEATKFAVVYIGKTKYSLEHESVLPPFVVLDSQLTLNLPPHLTATTGIDALCQAIEAYWSVHSNAESQKYSVEAIKLIWPNLPVAVNAPTPAIRERMLYGANLAGKAINIAKTTACHAVSYPVTSYYNVPHGQAVALTLGEMLEYNSHVSDIDCLDTRGVEYVRKALNKIVRLIGTSDIKSAKNQIRSFMTTIGLATTFSGLQITQGDLGTIIRNGFDPDRVKNNPRILTKEALSNMLIQLL